MPTPESLVKRDIKKLLDAAQAWYFMPVGGMFSRAGVPDFIGCYKGLFFAVEAKASGGQPTILQRLCLTAIAKAGGAVFITNEHNQGELEAWLQKTN